MLEASFATLDRDKSGVLDVQVCVARVCMQSDFTCANFLQGCSLSVEGLCVRTCLVCVRASKQTITWMHALASICVRSVDKRVTGECQKVAAPPYTQEYMHTFVHTCVHK